MINIDTTDGGPPVFKVKVTKSVFGEHHLQLTNFLGLEVKKGYGFLVSAPLYICLAVRIVEL